MRTRQTLTELDRIRIRLDALERIESILEAMREALGEAQASIESGEEVIRAARQITRKAPVGVHAINDDAPALNKDGTPRKRRGRPPKSATQTVTPPNGSDDSGAFKQEGILEEVTE